MKEQRYATAIKAFRNNSFIARVVNLSPWILRLMVFDYAFIILLYYRIVRIIVILLFKEELIEDIENLFSATVLVFFRGYTYDCCICRFTLKTHELVAVPILFIYKRKS